MGAVFQWVGRILALGCFASACLAAYTLWLIFFRGMNTYLTVQNLLGGYLPGFAWIRPGLESFLPRGFVGWFYDLPAIFYFPAVMVATGVIAMGIFTLLSQTRVR